MNTNTAKSSIREQFNQHVQHYLQNGPMGDSELLNRVVQLADPSPSACVLDVACGAGLLAIAFANSVNKVVGVDLSDAMLAEAQKKAARYNLVNISFQYGDSEAIPFANETFDIVTCKLALHYFQNPDKAMSEIKRVTKSGGRIVLVDRISSENQRQQEYHNQIEKLRTPSKKKVYAPSEILQLLEMQGLRIDHTERYDQDQDVDEWLVTTGAPLESQRIAKDLLVQSTDSDLSGVPLKVKDDKLTMTHLTMIVIANR